MKELLIIVLNLDYLDGRLRICAQPMLCLFCLTLGGAYATTNQSRYVGLLYQFCFDCLSLFYLQPLHVRWSSLSAIVVIAVVASVPPLAVAPRRVFSSETCLRITKCTKILQFDDNRLTSSL